MAGPVRLGVSFPVAATCMVAIAASLALAIACDDGASYSARADAGGDLAPDPDAADVLVEDADDRDEEPDDCRGIPLPADRPRNIESTHEVTFDVRNASERPMFLAVEGRYCETVGIGSAGAETFLPRSMGFECVCECPAPTPPFIGGWVEMEPASRHLHIWPARALAIYSFGLDCCTRGWPDLGVVSVTDGALQPVETGRYRAVFLVMDEPPAGCEPPEVGHLWQCEQPVGDGSLPGVLQELCPSDAQQVVVEFELGDDPDVDVDVEIGR